MSHTPAGRGRIGSSGFAPLLQVDAAEADEGLQESIQTPETFRDRVRRALRQDVNRRHHNQVNTHSSPAPSDNTLVGSDDDLDLPIQHFEDVDLDDDGDDHSHYVEYGGYYGPEAINISPTKSTKAGRGIEVYVESAPLSVSPGGLYIDGLKVDSSYHGSEGIIEKQYPSSSANYDYKPMVLKRRFLLALLGILIVFLVLAGISLHLLPDASQATASLPTSRNITEIRLRTILLSSRNMRDYVLFERLENGTDTGSTSANSEVITISMPTSMPLVPTESVPLPSPIESITYSLTDSSTSSTSSSSYSSSSSSSSSSSTSIPVDDSSSATVAPSTAESSSTTTMTSTMDTSSSDSTSDTIPDLTIQTIDPRPTNTPTATPDNPQDPSSTIKEPLPSSSTTASYPSHTIPVGDPGLTISISISVGDLISSTATLDPVFSSTNTDRHTSSDPVTETSTQPHEEPSPPNIPIPSTPVPIPTGDPGPHPTTKPETATETKEHTQPPSGVTTTTNQPDHSSTDLSWSIPDMPDSSFPSDKTTTETSDHTKTDDGSTATSNPWNSFTSALPTPKPPWTDHPHPPSLSSHDSSPPSIDLPDPIVSFTLPSLTLPSEPTSYPVTEPHHTELPGTSKGDTLPSAQPAPPSVTGVPISNPAGSEKSVINRPSGSPPLIDHVNPTDKVPSVASPTIAQAHSESSTTQSAVPVAIVNTPSPTPKPTNQQIEEPPEPLTLITITNDPITTTITTTTTRSNGDLVPTTMVTVIYNMKADVDKVLSAYSSVYTNSLGILTTDNFLAYSTFIGFSTQTDSNGKPTGTIAFVELVQPKKTTLMDPQGRPTATRDYYVVKTVITLFDPKGTPTATTTSMISETADVTTMFDEHGVATKTETILRPVTSSTTLLVTPTPTALPNTDSQKTMELRIISEAKYFAGLMLPTLLAIAVSIPIRILDQTAKLYQPFHALASKRGATAPESLCLETTGPRSLLAGYRALTKRGEVLLSLTEPLVVLSAIMVPFSAEVFRVVYQGPDCGSAEGDTLSCIMAIGVFPAPARAFIALVAVMAAVLVGIAFTLRRWRTGVTTNPWSLYYMAKLSANREVRDLLEHLRRRRRTVTNKEAAKFLRGKEFELDHWEDNNVLRYSVLLRSEVSGPHKKGGKTVGWADPDRRAQKKGQSMPFFILTWTGRVLFLLLLCAMIIAVLIYDTIARGSEYERGLLGKAVGVRFLFTGAGVLVTFLWGSFFYAVAFLSPYRLFRKERAFKGQAIKLNTPSNAFSGLVFSLSARTRDPYLGIVSATAILSEIIPLVLGNIPYNGAAALAETVCTWLSVAILSIMILAVAGSFFVDWPHMPIDPSTMVGAMYYACKYVLRR